MTFSVATWNINSVRLRLPIVESFLLDHAPDVLCLQETKCPNDVFPTAAFRKLGYNHVEMHGQKGYHGVATISKYPLEEVEARDFCGIGDTRHLDTVVRAPKRDIRIHNFYVPAGGDEPNPEINPKFRHKLDFLAEMRDIRADPGKAQSAILVGDLNIAQQAMIAGLPKAPSAYNPITNPENAKVRRDLVLREPVRHLPWGAADDGVTAED